MREIKRERRETIIKEREKRDSKKRKREREKM